MSKLKIDYSPVPKLLTHQNQILFYCRRISWWNVSYVFVDDTFGKRTLFEGNHTIRSIGFQLQLLGQESKSLYKKIR